MKVIAMRQSDNKAGAQRLRAAARRDDIEQCSHAGLWIAFRVPQGYRLERLSGDAARPDRDGACVVLEATAERAGGFRQFREVEIAGAVPPAPATTVDAGTPGLPSPGAAPSDAPSPLEATTRFTAIRPPTVGRAVDESV